MTQRLFLLSPDTIFAARVDQASITYPLSSVDFDTVTTGAYGDILVGMTVLFGSSAGDDDLGRQRIRAAADSDTIFFGRSSQGIRDGEINISDNDYITVIDDFRAWAKIPDIDSNGDIVKDEVTYTDQTDEIPPKANIEGGWRISTIDSGTSVSTFQFIGTASYAVAAGAAISTYLWDVDDGTITVGTSASNTITATFPAGQRWVSLTVTDDNGKNHTMRVLVIASPLNHSDCVAFQVAEHRATAEGQTVSFRVLEDIAESTYPDGTAVIMWEGEPASASDYSNVKFWGWHQTDQNTVTAGREATLKDTILTCLDIAGRLDTLPGFPESVSLVDSPSTWLEMAGLDMELYIDYLFRWHSTALENAYYASTIPAGYDMVKITSDGESVWDQAARMAKALEPDYRLTCDRNGQLNVIVDPFLQDTGDRTATSQATITAANWLSAQWQRIRPPRFHWNWGEAVLAYTAGVIDAVFCTAPGEAPGQGLTSVTTNFKLVQSQSELNAVEGHRYAYMNSFNGQIVITLPTDSGIEPADMTWVTLTIDDAYSRRSLGFSSVRCLPVEFNIAYEYRREGLVKTVELILEVETSGTPAVTYEPPDTGFEWDPPDPIDPPPVPTSGDGFGTNYFQLDAYIAQTRNLSAASPSWTDITGSITGTIGDFILDPFNPKTTGYAASTDGFWKSTNLDTASVTWTQIRTGAQVVTGYGLGGSLTSTYKISASINQEDFVAFWHELGGDSKQCCTITDDGGTSWTYNPVHSTGVNDGGTFKGAADYLPHLVSGEVVLGVCFETQSGHIQFSQSTDSGATWSHAEIFDNGSTSVNLLMTLHYPYHNNTAGQNIWFILAGSGGSGLHGLYQTTDGGSNFTKINAEETGVCRHGVESFTLDSQRLFHWRDDDTLWLSTNGGSSWTEADATGVSGTVRAAGGFPTNNQQYYVLTTAGVFVSTDNGATFTDKSGDWSNGFTISQGSGVVVPLWVKE